MSPKDRNQLFFEIWERLTKDYNLFPKVLIRCHFFQENFRPSTIYPQRGPLTSVFKWLHISNRHYHPWVHWNNLMYEDWLWWNCVIMPWFFQERQRRQLNWPLKQSTSHYKARRNLHPGWVPVAVGVVAENHKSFCHTSMKACHFSALYLMDVPGSQCYKCWIDSNWLSEAKSFHKWDSWGTLLEWVLISKCI